MTEINFKLNSIFIIIFKIMNSHKESHYHNVHTIISENLSDFFSL